MKAQNSMHPKARHIEHNSKHIESTDVANVSYCMFVWKLKYRLDHYVVEKIVVG